MTFVPAAMFAATTMLQYVKRSYRTRHVPAGIPSQKVKLSSMAILASASSAVSSKSVEYGVALIASILPVNSGWKVQKSSRTSSGERSTAPGVAITGMCCSQYHCQTFDSSIPSLHPVAGASDGRGHPVQTKAKSGGRGGAFLAWAASLDLDDLIGTAILFGSLFAMLCIGGW